MDSDVVDLTSSEENTNKLRQLLSTPPTPLLKRKQQQQQQEEEQQHQQQPQQSTSSLANTKLKYVRLSEDGYPPTHCSPFAAGFDLRSGQTVVFEL
ncbi:protein roadkill-like [Homalodisca vitripennis]|uniref:protein roadkill-like n=1 Tax=Homalodisca vitripennis TaxID=197043 RepID=UPI001EEC38A0|nr:protein roadkill-like isoform X5 [Homalodisca vitripennis]XP_046679863.1 protein roadkill-like [Homalodisca vitripennis]